MGVLLRRNRQDLIKTAEPFKLLYDGMDFSIDELFVPRRPPVNTPR